VIRRITRSRTGCARVSPRPTPWGSSTTRPTEYLRSIGHPYDTVRSGEAGDAREFPVLEVSVQYRQPLYFDDQVDVSLRIGAVRGATFQIAYLLAVGTDPRATAVTVHGCVDGTGRPARLPGWVAQTVAGRAG
jgi:acyl-CoA thioesterase FadM